MGRKAKAEYNKICVVCGNYFPIYTKKHRSKAFASRRQRRSVTCSKNCSTLYTRRASHNSDIMLRLKNMNLD
jgi:hypothetical protein